MSDKSPLIKRATIVIEAVANGFIVRDFGGRESLVLSTSNTLVFNELGTPRVLDDRPTLLGFVADHFKVGANDKADAK